TPKAGSTGFVTVRVDSQDASANADPATPINTAIDGNTFNTAAGATGTAISIADSLPSTNFTGVNIGVTTDNTYARGFVAGVSVSGGVATISDHITGATTGVQVTGGQVSLAGSNLVGNTTGVAVTGPATLTIGAGNSVTGGTTGMVFSGATAGL